MQTIKVTGSQTMDISLKNKDRIIPHIKSNMLLELSHYLQIQPERIVFDNCFLVYSLNDFDFRDGYHYLLFRKLWKLFKKCNLLCYIIDKDKINKQKQFLIVVHDICFVYKNKKQLFPQIFSECTMALFSSKNDPEKSIYVFHSIIPDAVCDALIKYMNEYDDPQFKIWEQSQNVCCLSVKTVNSGFDNVIFDCVKSKILHSMKCVNPFFVSDYDEGFTLRKIFGPTRLHTDGITMYPPKNEVRTCSIIIGLNSDFEGGDIVFPMQNKRIKLMKGEAILFPASWNFPHYTSDVENMSYRYTINTWCYERKKN